MVTRRIRKRDPKTGKDIKDDKELGPGGNASRNLRQTRTYLLSEISGHGWKYNSDKKGKKNG